MNHTLEGLSPVQLMVYTDRLHKSALEQMVNKKGLHRSQQMVLLFLLSHNAPISQAEIANHFKISPAAIAVTLKKLDAGGWIERKACPNNARMNQITLSRKSLSVVEEACLALRELDQIMSEGISTEQMQVFTDTLLTMQRNIRESFPGTDAVEPPILRRKTELAAE